jgi:hypothetical protein
MMRSPLFLVSALLAVTLAVVSPVTTQAFLAPTTTTSVGTEARSAVARPFSATAINVLNKKKPKEDLSFIETRDMTREEMMELNKKNEEIMNMELQAMTGFSLILSLPILYLCWVAFFSD